MDQSQKSKHKRHLSSSEESFASKKQKTSKNAKIQISSADTAPSAPLLDTSVSHQSGIECKLQSPSLLAELLRYRAIQALNAEFDKLVASRFKMGNNKFNHFEKWLLGRRLVASGADPVVPSCKPGQENDTWLDEILVAKLKDAGCRSDEAKRICLSLGQSANTAADNVRNQLASKQQRTLTVKTESFVSKGGFDRLQIGADGVWLTLNRSHYDKLRTLHERAHTRQTPAQVKAKSKHKGHDRSKEETKTTAATTNVNEHVLSVLLRYAAIQGASSKGGGYQAALPEACFDVLRDQFGVNMELFASPLNCRFDRFCSAFPDTDSTFGSVGSFFEFAPKEGSFEANPPFEPELVLRMAARMDELLWASKTATVDDVNGVGVDGDTGSSSTSTASSSSSASAHAEDSGEGGDEREHKHKQKKGKRDSSKSKCKDTDGADADADSLMAAEDTGETEIPSAPSEPSKPAEESKATPKAKRPLSFVVIIPHWPDQPCWQALNSSRFCRHHLLLPKFEHAFIEGDQHSGFSEKSRYALSVYDTSVFFLQNRPAKKQWPVTPEKLQLLVSAFQPIARARKLAERRKEREATAAADAEEDESA